MSRSARIGIWMAIAIGFATAVWAARADGAVLNLRDGATDAETAERLRAVNEQWERENPGQLPCRKCEYRPADSDLLWVYYRRQGFFPNWVSASRDLLRRYREGEVDTFRDGVEEIVSYSVRYTSPQGVAFRINESPYLSPDSTAPPWRDAMGQALTTRLFVLTLPAEPTKAQTDRALHLTTEYLNAFEVHWRDKGVAAVPTAGGRWFLEYATERGDRARVLNGFMQALVSLHKFAADADRLSADPRWAALRDRAREYVIGGAREVNANLVRYDFGRDKLSRYSLIDPNPAPPVYQEFHRQLLLELSQVAYLPEQWREHFDDVRIQWGGAKIGGFNWFSWWMITLMVGAAIGLALAIRRRQIVRRTRTRIRPRGPRLDQV